MARSRSRTPQLVALTAVAALGLRELRRRRQRLERARTAPVFTDAPPARRISRIGRAMDPYRHEPDAGYVAPPLPPAQIVPIPGRGEMFVRRGGRPDGTPVLLLHGWMATADLNWFPLFAALGERHPIVALDLRGHGRAPRSPGMFTLEECADDAAAVLRALGIARAVVVGYSMGGPVALLLWHRHPNLVNGLVLEATALEWSTSRAERLQWRAIGMVGLLLRWPTGRIALLRAMGGVESLPRSLLTYRSWAEGEFRRNDPMEMAEAGRALAAFDARPFAASVDVPSAVVVTTRDRLVPPARQLALAEAIGATVFRIDEDHSAVALRPDEVAEITLLAIAAVDVDLGAERRDEGPAPLSGDPAAAPGS